MSTLTCTKNSTVQCSISLYPMGSIEYASVVKECIEFLAKLADENNVKIFYHTMNTSLYGRVNEVFDIVRQLYSYSEKINADIVLNVSYSNCCPEP